MLKKKKNNDTEIVKENYNKNAQLEWERLEGFHFEFEIAKHYLKNICGGKLFWTSEAVRADTACGLQSRGTT